MTSVTIPKQGPNHRTNIYGVTAWNPRGAFHLRVFPVWKLLGQLRQKNRVHPLFIHCLPFYPCYSPTHQIWLPPINLISAPNNWSVTGNYSEISNQYFLSYKYETCFDWDWVQVFSLLCFLLWTLWFSVFLSPSITSPLSPLLSFTLRGSPQGEQNTCQSSSYRRLLEKKARELDETLSHAFFLSFFSWKSSLSNSPAAFSLGWPVWFE